MIASRTAALIVLLAAWIPLGSATARESGILRAAQDAASSLKARVGVAVYDTGNGQVWRYHADERFPMASTSKTLVCAALLRRGEPLMSQQVLIRKGDVQSYAPVLKNRVGQKVSASDLCAITLRTSDNTAVNAVLDVLGGPSSVTSFLRSMGDRTTRLDRNEPALNEGTPGDERDTTTPDAMVETLRRLVLGSVLDEASRMQLTEWLIGNEVAGPLLRASVPADWRVADRSGAGGFGTRGIAAVMWPPDRDPVVAAIYLTETAASLEERNAAIASIGRAIANAVTR